MQFDTVTSSVPIKSFERLRTETYTDVAALALLIYDYGLTFESEVTLLWPSSWNAIKILFILTRYMPFCDVILVLYYQLRPYMDAATCARFYVPAGWLIVIGIIIAELILVVRTWAIWGRDKKMGYVLAAACILGTMATFVIENMFLKSLVFSPFPNSATPGCLLTAGNPIIAVNFIFVMTFETFLLVLTLVKGVQHYRLGGSKAFVTVLYRDGVLFYVYLFSVSLINLLVIFLAPPDLSDMLALIQRILHSCLTSRVLINLRKANKHDSFTDLSAMRDLTFLAPDNSGAQSATMVMSESDNRENGVTGQSGSSLRDPER